MCIAIYEGNIFFYPLTKIFLKKWLLSISLISHHTSQEVSADPTNTFHSLHFSLLLFRLQLSQQCVCVYVPLEASVVPSDALQRFFSFHKVLAKRRLKCRPIRLRRVTGGAYLSEMFTVGSLRHSDSVLPPGRLCPL